MGQQRRMVCELLSTESNCREEEEDDEEEDEDEEDDDKEEKEVDKNYGFADFHIYL